ncbi:hypothetical protein VRC35_11185 [Erwinia aphidicola]|uniref:hypothetical protein n=1 Tax=Erwinia aphidicola TaxID=68334 RepID=UPI0030CD87C3
MPTVPMYNQRQVQSAALPANGVSVQTSPETFGAGFGELGQRVTGMFAEHQQRANVAMSQDALLQFQSYADDQLNNPETGLMTKQGKDVIGQADVTLTNIRGKADELMQQLPEGQVRENFLRQVNANGQQYKNQARTFEIGQVRQYETNQFQGILTSGVQNVSQMYGDNRAYVEGNKQIFDQIDQFGSAHGWSSEQIQAKKVQFKEQAAQQAVQNQLGADYMIFMMQNGEPADTGGSMRAPSGNQSEPRGVRNNNPGNIVATDQKWEGQTGSDGSYAQFATPEHGIRALGKNLLSYQRQGFDTVEQIIGRWAPPHENDTAAYIKTVAGKIGVAPGDKLELTNIGTLTSLSKAIMQHENGQMKFTDQQIGSGLQAALGINQLPPAESAPKRLTGMAAFEALNAADQGKFLRQAEAIGNQQKAQYRSQLEGVVKDANASYLKGVEFPNAPGQKDFIAAYGFNDGSRRFEEFQNNQVAGKYIGAFRTMPSSSITEYVSGLKNQLGEGEGFAGRASAFDHVEAAAKQVIGQRESNPYQAAIDLGAFKPISSSNPVDIAAEVNNRSASSDQLKAIGINAPLLSKEEAAAISGKVRGTTDVNQAITMLQSFGREMQPQALRSVAAAIAPDSAATAYSALILGQQDNQYNNRGQTIAYSQFVSYKPTLDKYEAAKTILQGDQLVNPTKAQKDAGISPVKLPSDDKLKQTFDDSVGTAFSHNPQARQMAWSIYKSAYAGLAYTNGDGDGLNTKTVDSDLAEKAVSMATGGVYKGLNGGDVVMPFGMDKSTFKDRYTTSAEAALKGAGLNPSGQRNFIPVNVGDGQYRLVTGSGRWATDPKTGAPVTVRVQ